MSKFTKISSIPKDTDTETKASKPKLVKDAGKKAAKAKAAPKAAKAKAPKGEKKERKERVSSTDDRKITVHTKANPHREGSGRHDAYEALKTSKKVSDYIEAGHKGKYLAKWEEAGFISLS